MIRAYAYISNTLYDACQDWISEGGNLTNVILTLPSKKAWKLDTDFRISLTIPKGFRVQVGTLGHVDLPVFQRVEDAAWPGSENWFYNINGTYGVGTSFNPVEKYYFRKDGLLDLGVVLLAIGILIVFDYIGFDRLGELFQNKMFGTVSQTRKVSSIYEEVSNETAGGPGSGYLKYLLKNTKVIIDAELDPAVSGSTADKLDQIWGMHENNAGIMELWLAYAAEPYKFNYPTSPLTLIKPSEVT